MDIFEVIDYLEDIAINSTSYITGMRIKNFFIIAAGIFIGTYFAMWFLTKIWLQSNIFWLEENPHWREYLHDGVAIIKLRYKNKVRTYVKRPEGVCDGVDITIGLVHSKLRNKSTVHMVDIKRAKRRSIFLMALIVLVTALGILAAIHIRLPS